MSAPQTKYGELSRERCLDIVRQISEAGILQVSLTGGEPLVRSDFLEIVDALLDRKITISQIYTNGVLVDEKLLAELERRKVKPDFSLSFDGVGWHDWLRGVDGAEEMAVEAIKLLRSHDFTVSIETSLHKGNIHTLEATLNLFREIGVQSWKTTPTADAGNWLKEAGKYNLNVDELYTAYLDFIPKFKAAGAPLSIMLGGFFMCSKGSEKYQSPAKKFDGSQKMLRQTICPSARNTMYIAADGKLLPCIPLTGLPVQEGMPSVTEMDICHALSDSRYLSLIDTRLEDLLKVNAKCNNCEHRLYCGGGCRAGALIGSGEYLACDDYTCYFFQNRYEEKIAALYEKGSEPIIKN
jgi:radical SAM protein with 4Fe4S-binding SPASM domain